LDNRLAVDFWKLDKSCAQLFTTFHPLQTWRIFERRPCKWNQISNSVLIPSRPIFLNHVCMSLGIFDDSGENTTLEGQCHLGYFDEPLEKS